MSTVSATGSTTSDAVLAALSSNSSSSSTTSGTSAADQQMKFLTLLTTQLKNQDPMNPMDNAQMTSQLAQISTVEGIDKLNATLQTLLDSQRTSDSMAAAGLVGKGVLVAGKQLTLTSAGAVGGFDLPSDADRVNVSISDANGLEIANLDLGSASAGSSNFFWDGAAADGSTAAAGQYTISVKAYRGDTELKATPLEYGQVTAAIKGSVGTDLQVGDLGVFGYDEIKQIL